MAEHSPRIKIVHLVTRMNTGGVAVLIGNLVRGLDPKIFEVTLLVGLCDSTEEDYLEKIATDIPFIKILSLQKRISLFSDMKAFSELRKLLLKLQPDILHTHTSKAGLLGRLVAIASLPKTKRIHTFHGHLLDGYFSKMKSLVFTKIEVSLAKKTHVLIAMGNQVKADLLNVGVGGEDKYKVFFPGLKNPSVKPTVQAREELGLALGETYCLFVGRLTQIKRPDRLLETFEILKKRNIQIKLLIVGDGELKESINNRLSELKLPAQMLGWVADTSTVFSAADMLVLTSDNEAVSLVLIEASQYGLPLISTHVGSVADVVIDNSTGYLTQKSPTAMADAIEKLVRDPELRKIMGAAGKARASQYFSLERMISDHSNLYKGL